MENRIAILSEALTTKIAAGEVVDRPAAIVKELLENAVDAGATDVRIRLEEGGCRSIRVTDNGDGLGASDAELAFQRYATSKIRRFEDIYALRTLGFRGEALPSIAAVARVEMQTRRPADLAGTRIVVFAGAVEEVSQIGCPAGTSILVSRLFEQVPVRRKFLRTPATEQRHCIETALRVILPHGRIRLEVTAGERPAIRLPAGNDMRERLPFAFGREGSPRAVSIEGRREGLAVRGFVSPPEDGRPTTRQMYTYVNGRFVRDPLLQRAVLTAYRRLSDPRRYPAAILFLDLSPADVDVNVHPAKAEVRFRDPRAVHDAVVEAIAVALAESPAFTGEADVSATPPYGTIPGRPAAAAGAPTPYPLAVPVRGDPRTGKDPEIRPPAGADAGIPTVSESGDPAEDPSFSSLAYLGQVAGTYLVFAAPRFLVLLDQHAAHERILFERFRRTGSSGGGRTPLQALLLPQVFHLSPQDGAVLEELLPLLADSGLEAEPFGPDAFLVKTVPAFLGGADPVELVRDIVEEWSETAGSTRAEEKRERLYALLACHGAVKARHILSEAEVKQLCRDLDDLPFRSTCPHGRPLLVRFGLSALESLFKRT